MGSGTQKWELVDIIQSAHLTGEKAELQRELIISPQSRLNPRSPATERAWTTSEEAWGAFQPAMAGPGGKPSLPPLLARRMCLYGTGLLIITPSGVGENQPSLWGKLPGRRELLLPVWGWRQATPILHTQLPSVSREGDGRTGKHRL